MPYPLWYGLCAREERQLYHIEEDGEYWRIWSTMTLLSSSSILGLSNLNPISFPSPKASCKNGFSALPPLPIRSTLSCDSTPLLHAARHTVDSYVESGMVIGLGSGRASGFAIQYLGQKLRTGALKDILGVPTSIGSASEAAEAGVPLDQYRNSSKIDLAFDDADVMEEETLAAVFGRQKMQGGESVIEEKTILKAARKLIIIVTGKQYRGGLDGSIPVLIKSINWMDIAEEIDELFVGDAEVWRRSSIGLVNPLGGEFPLITKEGHNVLDVIFTSPILNLADVADSLDQIDGVVEHGIIAGIPCTAVIASEDGLRVVDNTLGLKGSKL